MGDRWRPIAKIGSSVVAVFLLAVLPASPVAAQGVGNPTAGKALFEQDCASCHGSDASGGKKIGTATSADLRWTGPHLGPNGGYKGNIDLIKRAILLGKDEKGEDLDPAMPRWQGQLSDAQVNDIIAFLQTTGVVAAPVQAPGAAAAVPAALPKTGGGGGSPRGSQPLPLLAGFGALIVLVGFGLSRWTRKSQASS